MGELIEVRNQRANLQFIQMAERRHILSAFVEAFQQGASRLICQFRDMPLAQFHSEFFHALAYQRSGTCPDWINERRDFRRGPKAELPVASLAINTVESRGVHNLHP